MGAKGTSKYPVDSMQYDFIVAGLTLDQIKRKYHVTNVATLWEYSSKFQWVNKRKIYTEKLIDPSLVISDNLAKTIQPKTLIEKMELLIDKKLNNELAMSDIANSDPDVKIKCMVANKSKDGISDLTRTVELLRGNPTENILVSDEERESRRSRLVRMAVQVDNKILAIETSTLAS